MGVCRESCSEGALINHLALPAPQLPKYASVAREAVQQAYGYQSLAEAGDRVETYVQGIANLPEQPAADVAKAALTADRSKSAAWGAALLASCEVLTVPVAGPLSGILAGAARQAIWKPMFTGEKVEAARPFIVALSKDGSDEVSASVYSAALKTLADSPKAMLAAFNAALFTVFPATSNAALAKCALDAMSRVVDPIEKAQATRGFLAGLSSQTEDAELAERAKNEMSQPPDENAQARIKALLQSVPRS